MVRVSEGGVDATARICLSSVKDVHRYVGDVALDPAVMRYACDVKDMSRQEIEPLAGLVLDNPVPGQNDAGMRDMAERSAGFRCVVKRPLPARLVGGPAQGDTGNLNNLEAAVRGTPSLRQPRQTNGAAYRNPFPRSPA
jgi:hypothetical protein